VKHQETKSSNHHELTKSYLLAVDTQWVLVTVAIGWGGGDQLPWLEPSR
jgi:hypothetical protein